MLSPRLHLFAFRKSPWTTTSLWSFTLLTIAGLLLLTSRHKESLSPCSAILLLPLLLAQLSALFGSAGAASLTRGLLLVTAFMFFSSTVSSAYHFAAFGGRTSLLLFAVFLAATGLAILWSELNVTWHRILTHTIPLEAHRVLGTCPTCAYDLRSTPNPAGPFHSQCPECGYRP